MTMRRADQTKGGKLVFVLVLLSHCVLIFVISRTNTAEKSVRPTLREPLFIFFLDSIKTKPAADAIREPAPAKPWNQVGRPSPVPRTISPAPTDVDATSSNAITDWYAQAHSVAEDAAHNDRNSGAKRSFAHTMPSAQERARISIFDPLPVPRAGTWDGPNRFYITDNCYYEYDLAPQPPPTLLDNRLKTPVCKRPPKGGGDTMFKELTPDYLKTLPEPKNH